MIIFNLNHISYLARKKLYQEEKAMKHIFISEELRGKGNGFLE